MYCIYCTSVPFLHRESTNSLIDTKTKGTTQFRNQRALGYNVPSEGFHRSCKFPLVEASNLFRVYVATAINMTQNHRK